MLLNKRFCLSKIPHRPLYRTHTLSPTFFSAVTVSEAKSENVSTKRQHELVIREPMTFVVLQCTMS